jgi:hypothetical protein
MTNDIETYRARFRFKVLKKLRIPEREHRIKVAGRDVVISPPQTNELISASDWLIMNARGFHSASEATTFAHKLRAAADLSSVACRYGINSGIDLPTSGVGEMVRDHARQEHGMILSRPLRSRFEC